MIARGKKPLNPIPLVSDLVLSSDLVLFSYRGFVVSAHIDGLGDDVYCAHLPSQSRSITTFVRAGNHVSDRAA